MVRKTGLTIIAVLAVLLGVIVLPHTASAISLKQTSVVTGNTITVGDVFQGADNADKVLGLAPQPGQDMVLNARTLLRIAVALDMPWRPSSSADQIVVTRAASIVDRPMIEDAIRAKLGQEYTNGKYKVILPEATAQIILAPDIEPSVEIFDLNVKQDTGWFEAVAYSPSVANPVRKTTITGTIQKIVDVPVLRETLNSGSIIGQQDIAYVEMREKDVTSDMILNAEDMVGMTPRRVVLSSRAIKNIDIIAPQMIARGETVTMLFQQGGLVLTASGKALQAGAKGDTIRVLNQNSNKTIEGFVTASKEVTVKDF